MLSDINHLIQSIVKEFFVLARKPTKDSIGSLHDTERLKHNLSYATRYNSTKRYEKLEKGKESVLQHHFNNYELYGNR